MNTLYITQFELVYEYYFISLRDELYIVSLLCSQGDL
jgi:hypothetical protein